MKRWKNILCGVMAGIMVMASVVPAQAAAIDLETNYMIETNNVPPWPKASDIAADTAILMDLTTGTVIFDKGGDEARYPSSLTKLMTLLVAAENGNLDDQVTFTQTGVREVTPEYVNIGMQLGETMTLKDCLNAMIIASANEVAAQVAEYIGGTEAQFVDMMNAKAKEIGCKNTHFTNASGIPDPNQYTTARDMALIVKAGMKNRTFQKIIRTRKYTIPPTNMNGQERVLRTDHPLMSKYSSLVTSDCIGGKSGLAGDESNTLVSIMKKNGMTLLSVVMHEEDINQAAVDSMYLFDYGYENFQKVPVEGGHVLIPNTSSVADLRIREKTSGDVTRQVYYLSDYFVGKGKKAAVVQPVAQESSSADGEAVDAQTEGQERQTPVEEARENGLSTTAKILLVVMAVMAAVLVVLIILLAIKDHKANKRYKERQRRDY